MEDGTLGRYVFPLLSAVSRANLCQICNFLRHMATEIDLDAITPNANGEAVKTQFVTDFDPVRRKLQVISS